jgi:23S rRNA (pseudouridine1915-N3)-methyltransferase
VKLAVLTVGKFGNPWADQAVEDYAKRVKRYGGIDAIAARSEPFRGDIEAVRLAEGKRVLEIVEPRDRFIVLDERGVDVDTPTFTAIIETARGTGVPRMVFAIGGAYGHSPAVRAAAYRVVRLSAMVMNHEVARVVLYEQIYRAFAAIHGVPYAH